LILNEINCYKEDGEYPSMIPILIYISFVCLHINDVG